MDVIDEAFKAGFVMEKIERRVASMAIKAVDEVAAFGVDELRSLNYAR